MLAVLLWFILAVMWSVYFGMGILSARERRSMNSIAAFNQHLAVLARTTPGRTLPGRPTTGIPPMRAYAPPPRRMSLADARNRRRQMLTGLAATASVTAALAVVVGGPVLVGLHLLTDLLLVGYVVVLVRTHQPVADRRSTVVYLPRAATSLMGEPLYLQRSAN